MGNCINRASSYSAAEQPSNRALSESTADTSPRQQHGPGAARSATFARFADLPETAQSLVLRDLDKPSLKNLRLSGKAGAARCTSWWADNTNDFHRLLNRFTPQGIDGITLVGNTFTDAHLQMLPGRLTRFKMLRHFDDARITAAGFATFRRMRLRRLDLRNFGEFTDAHAAQLRGQPLEEIYFPLRSKVSDTGMENFQTAPLRIANVCLATRLTDAGVAQVFSGFLEKLNVQGCKKITDSTLVRVAHSRLRQLEVDYCTGITNDGIKRLRDSAVQSLGLSGCSKLTSACFDDLCAMPALQRLRLSDCEQISIEEMTGLMARLLRKNPAMNVAWLFD